MNIAFHVVPGASVPAAAVQLVNSVTPRNQWFSTEVADAQGQFVLSPGLDRLVVETGGSPVLAASSNTGTLVTAAVHEQVPVENLALSVREETAGSSSLLGTEANDVLAVISNGAVAGGTVAPHAVQASLVVSGALAFQTDPLDPAPFAGQVFQLVNPLVNSNRMDSQFDLPAPDELTIRPTVSDGPNEVGFQVNPSDRTARWDERLTVSTGSATMATDLDAAAAVLEQQAVSNHKAVLDKVFARLADEMDDFGDM